MSGDANSRYLLVATFRVAGRFFRACVVSRSIGDIEPGSMSVGHASFSFSRRRRRFWTHDADGTEQVLRACVVTDRFQRQQRMVRSRTAVFIFAMFMLNVPSGIWENAP